MSHFSRAHDQHLQPHDTGDTYCTECDRSNLDDPRAPHNQRCETTPGTCAWCCATSPTPCADCEHVCIPVRPAHPPLPLAGDPQTGRTGTPPTGDYTIVGIEVCAGCCKAFTTDLLTAITTEHGIEHRCWPCTEELRDMGLSA